MSWLYHTILYQPIYNALIFLYNIIPGHDIGVAIILLTILIKLILWPLSQKSLRSQKAIQDLQPKVDEIRKKYAQEKEKQAQELMQLYKNNKVNPLSSCLPLLIQFPFLIAVYQVFRVGLTGSGFESLYPFVTNPGSINAISFGFLNLAVISLPLAILSGAAQYIQTKMLLSKQAPKAVKNEPGAKDEKFMGDMNKSMTYFMPIMTVIIGASLPGGLTLYWFVTTVLTILQQKLTLRPRAVAVVIETKNNEN